MTTRFLDKPFASVQLLALTSAGLLLFGILMSVSTTIAAAEATGGSMWTQIRKEIVFVTLGIPIFWFAARLSPRVLRMLVYPFFVLGLAGLVAVLVPGIGIGVRDSQRWVDIGPLQLQPSEFAKLAMLLWGADLLARKQRLGTLNRARHLFIPLLPGFALAAGLVMLEPDLGTTSTYLIILLGLLWMVGMPLRYFGLVLCAAVGGVVLLGTTAPYRMARLTSFLDPFSKAKTDGYHAVEGLYALASGGWTGVGLGQGTSKYGWVPNANSDYVFAIIGEELGFLGCAAVLGLFGLLAFTGLRIARRNADPFVRLAAGTSTIWLCGQAVVNVGYVTALLPVTGIPLPLISAGGTSLLVTFFVLGMLVSFARHEAPAVTAARRSERLNRRSRYERWLALPVPRPYEPPRRRPRAPAVVRTLGPRLQSKPPLRPTGSEPAVTRAARAR